MRITGGVHRSRILRAPRGSATRPTSDRVREALFGILQSRGVVAGARVLDLYAGTGALGLEALSRGAEHATFVERGREALAALSANVEALCPKEQVRIVRGDVASALKKLEGPFDLVFLDPPYADVSSGVVSRIAPDLASLLSEGAIVMVEHASADEPPVFDGLRPTEQRRYGDTALCFYEIAQT
jgi:16S rRNA (guanine966-N2)-methyltransferase